MDKEKKMPKYKAGDLVYYYIAAGCLGQGIINGVADVGGEAVYGVKGAKEPIAECDLYTSVEEAIKQLSPSGRRMRYCLHEAREVYEATFPREEEPPCEDGMAVLETIDSDNRLIIDLAIELFRMGANK